MSQTKFTRYDLENHIKEDHKLNSFSEYLREIVYGGSDGIVTTFAVVAGFAGAQMESGTAVIGTASVILFGLANIFADGASMGLGGFLSIRSQQKAYKNHKNIEIREIKHSSDYEKRETEYLLKHWGFTEEDAHTLTKIYAKNPKYWTEFMMKYELDMQNIENQNAAAAGLMTFLSFVGFGFIPLLPYLITEITSTTFIYAIGSTAIALLLLSLLRFKVTKENLFACVAEVMLISGTSALLAYVVGTFF